MNLICTPCGQPVQDGAQVIYGVQAADGSWSFGWACCHRPAYLPEINVVLGSGHCLGAWIKDHMECIPAIDALFHGTHPPHRQGELKL